MKIGQDEFESGCELVDVTSLHRPNIRWSLTDATGHEHRWYDGDRPATSYDPQRTYTVPTLIWVKDGEEYWEDSDEPHDIGHLECRLCGEHIQPGYTADETVQYIPGLRWYRINGRHVSKEEFEQKLAEIKSHVVKP